MENDVAIDKHIKLYVTFRFWNFSFSIGWFSSENWKIFSFNILDIIADDLFTIFDLQVFKFIIGLYYYGWK